MVTDCGGASRIAHVKAITPTPAHVSKLLRF